MDNERETERQRERETDRQRQTDRQIDRRGRGKEENTVIPEHNMHNSMSM